MFNYIIHDEPNEKIFEGQCDLIEKNIPSTKKPLITDVDGALLQIYNYGENRIEVYNDLDIGVVAVKSTVDIRDYIKDFKNLRMFSQK